MNVAAIVDEKKVGILAVRKPSPGKGEVLVRIKACAICTWEQRVFTRVSKMPLPFIGGHEISGVIEEIGQGVDPEEFVIGRHVAVRSLNACGRCYYCRKGQENLCVEIGKAVEEPHKEIYGPGGLGEYLVANLSDIFMLSDGIPYEVGAFTEPVACVVNSLKVARVDLGNDVVVIGAGIMGLLHVMLSKLRGAFVIVSEPDEQRRITAKKLGADIVFNPLDEPLVDKVKDLTEGRGADVVFNTTAIAKIAEEAVLATGKMGRVVMYSSIHPDKPIEVSPNWIHNTEVNITGAVSPSIESFYVASVLLSKGIIDPSPLISAQYPLEETQKAFEDSIRPDTYRIIVKM